jgi:hypothetical protein
MSFDVELGRAHTDTCVLTQSAGGKRLFKRWLAPRRG